MKNGMLDNQKQNIDGKEKERFFVWDCKHFYLKQ
jgi:hypothetical protein